MNSQLIRSVVDCLIPVDRWWPPGHIIGYEHTFTHTVLELLQALDEQRLPVPNFYDGVKNQRVLDAVERSATSRRWESIQQ